MGVAVDDQAHGILRVKPALVAVEELFITDFRCGGLMLHDSCRVKALDVGESVGPAFRADQKAVALGIVPGAYGPRVHPHKASVAVLAVPGRDTFADDPAFCSPADVDHLCSGVRLLEIVGDSD